jgi:hypothetical protein
MALPLPAYIVDSALSLEDRHGQTLIHSDYSIILDLVNQYHSTPVIHMPLQLSIRHLYNFISQQGVAEDNIFKDGEDKVIKEEEEVEEDTLRLHVKE